MKINYYFNYISFIIIIVLIAVLMVGVIFWYYSQGGLNNNIKNESVISNFEECVNAGYPVMESYPRQCAVDDVTYTEIITNQNSNTNIASLSDEAKLQIATYTDQSCTTDDDCGIFPCLNGACLIKECTCNCGCSGNECGGVTSQAPGYCISEEDDENLNTGVQANVNFQVHEDNIIDTSDWLTYKTSSSSLISVKERNPSFSFKYPNGWHISEELGGTILREVKSNGEIIVDVDGVTYWPLYNIGDRDNILDGCKDFMDNGDLQLTLDEARELTLNGRPAVFLSYSVPDEAYQTDEHRNYFYGVCIKETDDTMLTIKGKPRDSDFIQQYFNKFIQTVSIEPFVDLRIGTEVGSDYQYTDQDLGINFRYPQNWKIHKLRSMDGRDCHFIILFAVTLDSDNNTSPIKKRIVISQFLKEGLETNNEAFSRLKDSIYILPEQQPVQYKLFGSDTNLYIVHQYTATDKEFNSLVQSFKVL